MLEQFGIEKVAGVVVDQEDIGQGRKAGRRKKLNRRMYREIGGEGSAFAGLTLHVDTPAAVFYYTF